MTQPITYDINATVSLLSTEQGGRKKPVYNHYRPSFTFGSLQHYSGEVIFQPGQSAIALIKLLPAKHINKHLKSGMTFKIHEGNKIVGIGLINSIAQMHLV